MSDNDNIILKLTGLSKRFGPVIAADNIDLELHRGEVLALLGENGAGKTTLMNMLFGHYTPDEGSVEVRNDDGHMHTLPPGQPQAAINARIGMVHQHFALAENLTVLDNILLGSEPIFSPFRKLSKPKEKIKAIMSSAGLEAPLDEKVGNLSVGERQRVEILKALYRDAKILVLDEPTAVLTPQEADSLFASIRTMVDKGLSVIFISHKLREVLAFSDRIAVLRHGRKVGEMKTSDADTNSIAKMMVGADTQTITRESFEAGAPILSLTNISTSGERASEILREINFEVCTGQIVGIAGVSGNGQSALAALISGLNDPKSGTMEFNGEKISKSTPKKMIDAGIGRIPEDRHRDGVVGSMSIAHNLIIERLGDEKFNRFGFLRNRQISENAQNLSKAYDIRGPGIESRTALLSGGNMQKLILARILDTNPKLIIANQPTRGLDFGAAAEVGRRLLEARQRGAGVILISEDLDEILTLCDQIFVAHDGGLTRTDSRDRAQIGLLMTGHTNDKH
ncbi:MAG: ABC transporter ATP-binding protein [Devosiaceae bacterium]|nr:ABC transporter ATP-binding protein [Devosiaceae bacterium]